VLFLLTVFAPQFYVRHRDLLSAAIRIDCLFAINVWNDW
jgi:hypothetical protein